MATGKKKSIFRKHMVTTEYSIQLATTLLLISSTLCKAGAAWDRTHFNKCHIFSSMAYLNTCVEPDHQLRIALIPRCDRWILTLNRKINNGSSLMV